MRCLVISDIHANLFGLEAVLKEAEGSYDQVWCLGDIVGYGPYPNECVDLIGQSDGVCVAGNHDWAALGKLAIDDFNPDAQTVLLWTRQELSASSTEFLSSLKMTVNQDNFTLTHGSPRYPLWEYVLYPSVADQNFAHFTTRHCLVGHTHSVAVFHESSDEPSIEQAVVPSVTEGEQPLGTTRLIVNPGSVGQPRNGDARASYCLLDLELNTLEFCRVAYPITRTQQRMLRLGFPPRLISRLSFGW